MRGSSKVEAWKAVRQLSGWATYTIIRDLLGTLTLLGLTSPFSWLGPLLLPWDGAEGGRVQCHAQHLPGSEVRGADSAGTPGSLPGAGFSGQQGWPGAGALRSRPLGVDASLF